MNGTSSESEIACVDQGEEVLPELITFSSGEAFFYLIPSAASYGEPHPLQMYFYGWFEPACKHTVVV